VNNLHRFTKYGVSSRRLGQRQIPGSRHQQFYEYQVTTTFRLIHRFNKWARCGCGGCSTSIFRSRNHVLTLISSLSARVSATHGVPHLPNLKRRLPEEKKTAQKAGSHGEDKNGLHRCTITGLWFFGLHTPGTSMFSLRLCSAVGIYLKCIIYVSLRLLSRRARSPKPRYISSFGALPQTEAH
jgi:hypothetical protein